MFEIGQVIEWKAKGNRAIGEIVQLVDHKKLVQDIAVSIYGPAAKVRIIRDGILSNDYVGIPLNNIDRVVSNATLKRKYGIHPPTMDELQLINQYIPSGAPERTAADTVVLSFVAADNLLTRALDKWDIPSLEAMVNLTPGLPVSLNHAIRDVSLVWGKIFDSHYEHFSSAPGKAIDAAGNGKSNREIVKKEGFSQVIIDVFTTPNNPVFAAIQNGWVGKVSTGSFEFSDLHCPECDVSFWDEKCEHYPPDKWWGMTADKDPSVARYAIRVGLKDMGEVSIVSVPNLPNAGVI